MDEWEELESWHEDLIAWERFQDEYEKINGEDLYERLQGSQNKKRSLQQEPSHNFMQNTVNHN